MGCSICCSARNGTLMGFAMICVTTSSTPLVTRTRYSWSTYTDPGTMPRRRGVIRKACAAVGLS